MGHAQNKMQKLAEAKRLYLLHPNGLTDIELSQRLEIDRVSAYRYRNELAATQVSEGRYTINPSQDDIDLALAVLQRANNGYHPAGDGGTRATKRATRTEVSE